MKEKPDSRLCHIKMYTLLQTHYTIKSDKESWQLCQKSIKQVSNRQIHTETMMIIMRMMRRGEMNKKI